MTKQGCLSSPEQVLVNIRYSGGLVVLLVAGVKHGRVAVHEGHLGMLGKIVLVHRNGIEIGSNGQTSHIVCLVWVVWY